MSQEIIYTSAPQGLRPGSFGFCIVAMTTGMPTPLAERLESLSGYRHVYSPGDPRAVNNPVVHSHVQLKIGAQKYFVLSRLADAGFDYSQRTNKLVHHVALEPSELVPAGPAWVLSQPGYMVTSFSGQPHLLPAGRRTPAGEIPRTVCHRWGELTGDPGWGAVLASSALTGGALTPGAGRPVHLIVPEGLDPLPLIVEAQSLLPSQRRWEVSFSTFFTRLPPGVECQWRCVLAGTPEATALAGMRGDLVIDLTRPLGPAPDTPLSAAARTGVFPAEPAPTTRAIPTTQAAPVQLARPVRESAAEELRLGPPPAPGGARARTSSSGVMIIDDGPPELPGETTPPPMTSLHRRSAPSAGFGWSHLTAVAMVAALVGVVVGYLFRSSQTDPAPIATQTAAPAIPATDNQPPAPPAAAAPDPQPPAMPSPAPPATPPVSPVGEKNTANAENPASKSPTGDTTPAAANGGTAQPMPAAENPPTPSVPTPVPAPPAVVELKYGPEPLESILALKHGSDPREIKLASFPKSDGSAISKIELLGAPKSLRIEKSKDNSWVVQFNNGTKIGSDIPTAEFTQVEEGSSFALMASQRTPGVAWNDLCGSVIQVIHEKGQEHILYLVKPHLVVTKQGKISPCFVEYNMPYLELMDRFDKELFFDVSDIHIETIPSGNWKSATKGRWQHTYVCHNATEIDTQVEAEFSGQPRKTTKIAIRVRFHQKDSTKLLDENAIQDIGNRLSNYRKVFLDEWEKAKLDRDNAEKDFNAEAKPEEKEKKRQKLDVLKNKFIEIDSSRERFDSDYPKIITTSEGREVIASLSKNASAKSAPRAKVTIGREIKTESQSIKVPYLLLVD